MTNHTPYKSILSILLILALCFALFGCGDKEPVPMGSMHVPDQTEENYGVMAEVRTPFEDPELEELFITAVRNAVPDRYPDVTLGEAFDHYFSSPEWSAFEGASSYSDDTIDYVVEFKGICMYKEAEAEALIQFTFDPEFKGFEATFFSVDGEPMTFRDLNEVSEIAYYQYSEELKEAGQ